VRCETFLEHYDRIDARSEPGWALRRHLDSCPSCRATVERMRAALQAPASDAYGVSPAEASVEDRVMAVVRLMPQPQRELFSVRDWIIAGSVIVLSMALIPVGSDFGGFIAVVGASYALPLALVLGLGITIYSTLFIGTHIDEVMDFVRRRIVGLH